jgi:hypothetical protein
MIATDRKLARAAALAALAYAFAGDANCALAQAPTAPVGASMVQPPQSPASGVSAHNPDNMPIKKPQRPPRDPIARRPPASATNAK